MDFKFLSVRKKVDQKIMSIFNSFKWVGLGQFVRISTQLVALFYLTRLIAPADYGLLAMASVVMNLANIFNDMGTGTAVIQRQNASQGFYNYIYRINVFTGIFIMLFVIAISPLIVNYFNRDELYPILCLLALSFPISSLTIVHKAKLEKEMAFQAVVKIEIFASFVGMILAIILANLNFGVYSLIFQTLITISISTLAFLKISDLTLSLKSKNITSSDKAGVIGFSGYLLSFNLINYFSRNLDSILIGRFFSATILGAYSIAYRIMLFPLQSLTFVISRVFLPHFSKNINNTNKNKQDYLRALQVILSLSAPLMLGLAATSISFTALFFDDKWYLIGELLLWLAPTAIIQSALSTTGTVFMAYGKTKWLFILGCIGALLMGVAFGTGIFFDIKTLVVLYFIANLINFFPSFILMKKILNFRYLELINVILRSVFPAILMFVLLKVLQDFYSFEDVLISFFINVLLGIFSYIVFYTILNFNDIQKIKIILKNKLRNRNQIT